MAKNSKKRKSPTDSDDKSAQQSKAVTGSAKGVVSESSPVIHNDIVVNNPLFTNSPTVDNGLLTGHCDVMLVPKLETWQIEFIRLVFWCKECFSGPPPPHHDESFIQKSDAISIKKLGVHAKCTLTLNVVTDLLQYCLYYQNQLVCASEKKKGKQPFWVCQEYRNATFSKTSTDLYYRFRMLENSMYVFGDDLWQFRETIKRAHYNQLMQELMDEMAKEEPCISTSKKVDLPFKKEIVCMDFQECTRTLFPWIIFPQNIIYLHNINLTRYQLEVSQNIRLR